MTAPTNGFAGLATEPWTRTDPGAWKLRDEHRFGPRCGEVNHLVEQLRAETGEHVPWLDPFCGGVDAPVLLVLKRPGPKGAIASDYLSLANADQTAKNTIEAMRRAGLAYGDLVFWNAIPWSGPREERFTPAMRQRGEDMLGRLLTHLEKQRAVLLVGNDAHPLRAAVERCRPEVRAIACAHPSPLAWKDKDKKKDTLDAFLTAAAVAKPGR